MKKSNMVLMGSLIFLLLSLGITSGAGWISKRLTNTLGDSMISKIAVNGSMGFVVWNTEGKVYKDSSAQKIKREQPAQPDLVVDRLYFRPMSPTVLDQIAVSAVVKNTGTSTAGASVMKLAWDRFSWDGTPLEAGTQLFDIKALEPGAYSTVTQTVAPMKAGSRGITARADVNNVVAESNENNNFLGREIIVRGVPDLVSSISIKKLMWPPPLWII